MSTPIEKTAQPESGFSRREFLIKGGIVFGGTLVLLQSGCAPVHRAMSGMAEKMDLPSGIKEFQPDFWFQVLPDNSIRMVMPKCEMGQGIFTGFAILAAEELDVTYEQMRVVPSNTNDPMDTFGTGGSTSTMSMYRPIREVAAQMRQMLVLAAATHWNTDVGQLTTSNGIISNGTQQLTYAEVVSLTQKWPDPGKPAIKNATEFKIIGRDVKRNDLLAKVKGDPIFGIDYELPGMVYGVFIKSPFLEAKPKSVNTAPALQIAGVQQVVQQDGLLAVIASNRYAAEMGARAVEVVWEFPKKWTQPELNALVTVGNGERAEIMKEGRPDSKFVPESSNYLHAEYRTSAGSHAQLEPNGAIAHYENGTVKIIAGIQGLQSVRAQICKLLGVKEENVFIQNAFLGGGFGRKSFYQDAAQIALISKIIGKPVHIFGTRTQEFQNGYLRPPTHHTFDVQLSDSGKIEAINYQLATDNMLLSYYPSIAEFLLGSDPASSHGSRISYEIRHRKVTYWKTKVPYQVGSWRGIGMYANTFAIESLMDELAQKAKADPVDFRLKHLNAADEVHARQIHILKRLVNDGVWANAKQEKVGRGIACADDRKTIVATVAEVMIENNQIKVKRITSAIDAGRIVNPEGVRQQVEGCAIMGLGATLLEKIEIENGAIGATNFHQYSVPLITDIPEINVILMESDLDPLGVGEPPIAPISAAIANAVFDLTGKRLRNLPLNLNEADSKTDHDHVSYE